MTDVDNQLNIINEQLKAGQRTEALTAVLPIVSSNWNNSRARLTLARVFYQLNLPILAAREVAELLKNHRDSTSLKSLLNKLDPTNQFQVINNDNSSDQLPKTEDQIVAEADFEIDILDELD